MSAINSINIVLSDEEAYEVVKAINESIKISNKFIDSDVGRSLDGVADRVTSSVTILNNVLSKLESK